jgi:hypothetical protein
VEGNASALPIVDDIIVKVWAVDFNRSRSTWASDWAEKALIGWPWQTKRSGNTTGPFNPIGVMLDRKPDFFCAAYQRF